MKRKSANEGAAGVTAGEHHARGSTVVVWELGTSRKVVALTFDTRSDAGYTEQILDTLKANGRVRCSSRQATTSSGLSTA